MAHAGWWGGYFRDLGVGGGVQVAIFAAVGAAMHTYLGKKIATSIGKEVGDPTAELATTAAMVTPAMTYGALVFKGIIKDTDAANVFGNLFGGILVWETANFVETIMTILEGGKFDFADILK